MKKALKGVLITGVVLVGLLAQAVGYLLALVPANTTPGEPGHDLDLARQGEHEAGIMWPDSSETPLPVTVWYPARVTDPPGGRLGYSYAMNMLGADSAVAFATYEGHATPNATADGSGAPYPVVVLSHGFAITPGSYAWLAEHLATHGMVVVAPAHAETLDPGALWRSTVIRPIDVRRTLDHVEETMAGLADVGRVAVIGHSYGGYTALASAGAVLDSRAFEGICESVGPDDPILFQCDALLPHLEDMAELAGLADTPAGLWPSWGDPRVDAVVAMAGDAVMFTDSGLSAVTVPVMAMGGTADRDAPFRWGTQLTYENVSSERKIEVTFQEAAHMVFAGECDSKRRVMDLVPLGFCSDPGWDRDQVHEVVKHLVTGFLREELFFGPGAGSGYTPGDDSPAGVEIRHEGY